MASSNSSNSNSPASAAGTAASSPAAAASTTTTTTTHHHHRRTSSFGTATSFDELMASSHSSSSSLPGSAPRSRRNSLFNPLPYNPDLLDTLNFHGAARPRRPSFGGTLSLGGMDLIPSAGMMMMNEHAGAGAGDSYSSVHTLETQFCKDFECCGTQFPSLHELLSHYETVHVNVKDFADFSTFSDTLFSPGGSTSMVLDHHHHHHQMDLSLASLVGGPSSAKLETIQEEEDAESQCSNGVGGGGGGSSATAATAAAAAGPASSVVSAPTASTAPATVVAPATVALNQLNNSSKNNNNPPMMFPSPAPSHASLPFTEIQEGIRHLHIDPSQQFTPYPPALPPPPGGVTPNLVVSQHPSHVQQQPQQQSQHQPSPNSANLVVPETTVYMPSNGKRSRAPSLVAMNLPPDEVKKIRSLDGNYHSGASGTSGDESVPSPSLSHASAPDTPRASHNNGSTVHHNSTNGTDQIMTDAMINAMHGHPLPTADFFTGHQQQQQPRGSPMLGGARPLAQPHPRAHPATAAHQQQLHHAFSQNASAEQPTVGVSPHLAHLHSPFDLPSAPQAQGQAFPRSGTPGLMISHDRPHFQVEPPPPRPSSTPVMINAGHLGGHSPLQQHQQLHHQHPHQQHQRHPPTSTPPNGWMSAPDGQDMQAFVDEVYGLAPGGAQGGGGKRYKCPRAFCSKVYKNSNGLKYHLEHGNCELDYAQGQQSGQQQQQQQQQQQPQHGEYPAAAPSHPDFAPFADMASPPSQPLQPPQQQQQQQQHPAGNGTPPPAHAPPPPPQFINPNVASGPYVTSPMMHAAVAGSSSSSGSSSPLMPPHIIPVYHGTPMHHHHHQQQQHPHHPQHPQHPQIQHQQQQHQLHMLQQQHPGLHAQQQQQLAMHYANHPHMHHPQHHPHHMQAMAGMGYPIVAQDIKIALRPYWCRQCPKKYKNLNGLKYHAKVAHADLDFKTQVKGHTSMNL
ncbi:hypothetical protein HDU87_006274 [Geranomyces variabilis]|uniref:C2H2-type domain-containing protein n=1 Tax=Geranomyces variabilis TaxID=109894 RepID=A0AAD5XQM9_9FUNG|nr:hypothetical protein HDU87_006274 [Geranomyces variabilis]